MCWQRQNWKRRRDYWDAGMPRARRCMWYELQIAEEREGNLRNKVEVSLFHGTLVVCRKEIQKGSNRGKIVKLLRKFTSTLVAGRRRICPATQTEVQKPRYIRLEPRYNLSAMFL